MTASGSPVIIFSQKGNKGVISFPYASVKFDPRRAVLDLADRNRQFYRSNPHFSFIDMNNKWMQVPFFRLTL